MPLLVIGQGLRMRFRERSSRRDAELMEEAGKVNCASETVKKHERRVNIACRVEP